MQKCFAPTLIATSNKHLLYLSDHGQRRPAIGLFRRLRALPSLERGGRIGAAHKLTPWTRRRQGSSSSLTVFWITAAAWTRRRRRSSNITVLFIHAAAAYESSVARARGSTASPQR